LVERWPRSSTMKYPMTAEGHAGLQDELRRRIRNERPQLAERIQEAIADDPNLVENSGYQAAVAEQAVNEKRIAELEDKLARAEIIDVSKLSGETVKFGATVTLIDEDSGERRICQIVGEPEADASKGKISVGSPIGRALIGKAKGTAVVVETPRGDKTYRIQQVEWLGGLKARCFVA
jgi:transcription elongation factor GreA